MSKLTKEEREEEKQRGLKVAQEISAAMKAGRFKKCEKSLNLSDA